jgi:hypothetical protein
VQFTIDVIDNVASSYNLPYLSPSDKETLSSLVLGRKLIVPFGDEDRYLQARLWTRGLVHRYVFTDRKEAEYTATAAGKHLLAQHMRTSSKRVRSSDVVDRVVDFLKEMRSNGAQKVSLACFLKHGLAPLGEGWANWYLALGDDHQHVLDQVYTEARRRLLGQQIDREHRAEMLTNMLAYRIPEGVQFKLDATQ